MSYTESQQARSRRLEAAADQWLKGGQPSVRRRTDGRETKEPWFETHAQKLEFRARLRKYENRHQKLAQAMTKARRCGLLRPADWSQAHWAEYEASPWDLALAEQRASDAQRSSGITSLPPNNPDTSQGKE